MEPSILPHAEPFALPPPRSMLKRLHVNMTLKNTILEEGERRCNLVNLPIDLSRIVVNEKHKIFGKEQQLSCGHRLCFDHQRF